MRLRSIDFDMKRLTLTGDAWLSQDMCILRLEWVKLFRNTHFEVRTDKTSWKIIFTSKDVQNLIEICILWLWLTSCHKKHWFWRHQRYKLRENIFCGENFTSNGNMLSCSVNDATVDKWRRWHSLLAAPIERRKNFYPIKSSFSDNLNALFSLFFRMSCKRKQAFLGYPRPFVNRNAAYP